MHDADKLKAMEFFQSRIYAEKIQEPQPQETADQENIENFLNALRPTEEELQALFNEDSENLKP